MVTLKVPRDAGAADDRSVLRRPDAKLVTYGAMGRSPVHIPPAKQIFQGLSSHGFWVSGRCNLGLCWLPTSMPC